MSKLKHILITGAFGQLGSEFKTLSKKQNYLNFIFTDIDSLDITSTKDLITFFDKNNIDLVINCAAYTAVDKAETEQKTAELINVDAVNYLVNICNKYNILLFHFSTDYIFNGKNNAPYKEDNKPDPQTVYGKTKLEAENLILNNLKSGIIFRISWLYSSFGNNFIKTMIRLGKEKKEIRVVSDQIGVPTYAHDLANDIINIIGKINNKLYDCSKPEIFHYTSDGYCSWYELAKEIMIIGNTGCKVIPIETKDYPTAAKRPPYSVLDTLKLRKTFGIRTRHWKESLEECIQLIEN
ncbi:dTDP-4-dehydrorhamnose reductase [Bacteroidota bacterium]